MAVPLGHVIRQGVECCIAAREVVPGDVAVTARGRPRAGGLSHHGGDESRD